MKRAALLSILFSGGNCMNLLAMVNPPDPQQLLQNVAEQQQGEKNASESKEKEINTAAQSVSNQPSALASKSVGPGSESAPAGTAAAEKSKTEDAQALGGIDTVNIEDGGNWLLKRKAVEDTINELEKIKNLYTMILETLQGYLTKRNAIDAEYDIFVAQLQFDIGDAEQLINDLIEQVNIERKKEGDLSEQERELLDALNQKQKDLEEIKEGIKAFTELDSKVVEVLTTVDNQIKMANNHQNQAWKNFQEMKQVLSDERAEELYYQTVGLNKSMQEIYAYLKSTLADYFNEQIKILREQMAKVKTAVERLRNSGLDLKTEFQKFEQQDIELEKKRMKEEVAKEVEEEVDEIELEKKQRESRTWWHFFKQAFATIFRTIGNFFAMGWNAISSIWTKKATVTSLPETVQTAENSDVNDLPVPIEQIV